MAADEREQNINLLLLLEELNRRNARRKFLDYFPDEGEFARHKYPKHLQFFEAGATYRERAIIAANRIGKTESIGGYEMTCHLTGIYPTWWPGRRFDRPVDAWCAGKTLKTTRDIIQTKLVGPPEQRSEWGTGVIPGEYIVGTTSASGSVANCIDTVQVRHVPTGKISRLGFKSYDQGRGAFEGTEKDLIWYDEEPPADVYTEGLIRTMTCKGMVMCTFTPLEGLSDVVLLYMPGGKKPEDVGILSRFVVFAGWDDVPHLDRETKEQLMAAIPPHEREARSKGTPQLGSGAIYPVDEERLVEDDFKIPDHWARAYGMDVGWNRTAAIWGAIDRESDVLHLGSCHYEGKAEPVLHATAIKARGAWIPGVIDPAANGRAQKDGEQLMAIYTGEECGLKLLPANNAVEAGIYAVWSRMTTGRLKVFRSLAPWFNEFRIYRRDQNGKIVKENDHLMDATRYLVMSGLDIAQTKANSTAAASWRDKEPKKGSWRSR